MAKPSVVVRAFIGSVLTMAAAWLMYAFALRPALLPPGAAPTPTQPFGGSLPAAEHRGRVLATWKSLAFTPLADGDITTRAEPAALARALAARVEVVGSVPDRAREALPDRLAADLIARAASPNIYADYAEADRATRWTAESDPAWRGLAWWFTEEHRRAITGSASRTLLEQFLEDVHGKYRGALHGVSTSEEGCRVRVSRIRVREQLWLEFDNALPRSERDYWMRSNSGTAYRFRLPRVSLDDVLRRDGIATVAACMVVVRTTGGECYNLSPAWFWDPALDAWVCDEVVRKGWNSDVIVYR